MNKPSNPRSRHREARKLDYIYGTDLSNAFNFNSCRSLLDLHLQPSSSTLATYSNLNHMARTPFQFAMMNLPKQIPGTVFHPEIHE